MPESSSRDRILFSIITRKLIQLRKQHEIIVYGKYELLDGTNPDVYAYTELWIMRSC